MSARTFPAATRSVTCGDALRPPHGAGRTAHRPPGTPPYAGAAGGVGAGVARVRDGLDLWGAYFAVAPHASCVRTSACQRRRRLVVAASRGTARNPRPCPAHALRPPRTPLPRGRTSPWPAGRRSPWNRRNRSRMSDRRAGRRRPVPSADTPRTRRPPSPRSAHLGRCSRDHVRMPEGDTVWLTAHRLDAALAGRTLTRCDLRVPQLATTDLSGRHVEAVVPRGKHLLTRIEGGITLHSHLMMDGSWHLYAPGERWRGGRHTRSERYCRHRTGSPWAIGSPSWSSSPPTGRTPPWAIWARICWGRAGTRRRRSAGSPPSRTGPPAKPCWTSAIWPGWATSTSRSCAFCAGSRRGHRYPA